MTRLVTEYSKSDFWVMELAEILWVFKVFVVQKLKKRPFQMNLCLHSIYFKKPMFWVCTRSVTRYVLVSIYKCSWPSILDRKTVGGIDRHDGVVATNLEKISLPFQLIYSCVINLIGLSLKFQYYDMHDQPSKPLRTDL